MEVLHLYTFVICRKLFHGLQSSFLLVIERRVSTLGQKLFSTCHVVSERPILTRAAVLFLHDSHPHPPRPLFFLQSPQLLYNPELYFRLKTVVPLESFSSILHPNLSLEKLGIQIYSYREKTHLFLGTITVLGLYKILTTVTALNVPVIAT